MLSFLFNQKKTKQKELDINGVYEKLKLLYKVCEIPQDRKETLAGLINKHGYLPYSHQKALEEITDAEVLFGLEIKWENNAVFDSGVFSYTKETIHPAVRAGYKNSDWIKKEQHNIKLINLAGLGNGNKSAETGKLADWLRQLLILPVGSKEKNILAATIYLIPFHPREFGCAYLPTSSEVSQNLEDKLLKENMDLDAQQQVKLFIMLAKLAGHSVIYDILPQTGRFSKAVLSSPQVARWYDISALIEEYKKATDSVAEKLENDFDKEDVEVITKIFKTTLTSGSCDLSDYYQIIYNRFEDELLEKKKELSNQMLTKTNQAKLHKRVKEIVASSNGKKQSQISEEEDIKNQGQTIQNLIKEGLWPAPGGAWCSAGVPVFNKMSECSEYPTFRHFDFKGADVTDFANLDCQTPFYFVYLESGEYNKEVINFFINQMKKLQEEYNFDGYRVDHIDHIVDDVSQTEGIPISYRAPSYVLERLNKALKHQVPHFASVAEYMLWDKFYKEYHQNMGFDLLWGDDIISQYMKTPEEIISNNRDLQIYNSLHRNISPLSIIKTYNNQDGEFRAIDQYPGQLGEDGALFKWLKYKFLPGGQLAQRPIMFVDGDESFTKTGVESAIGAEIAMKRENKSNFYDKFMAINDFALNCELTASGDSEILIQDEDGFVAWLVSKDPLKESLLVVANYQAPTEKIKETSEDEIETFTVKKGTTIFSKAIDLPCDYTCVAQIVYDEAEKSFVERQIESTSGLKFESLKPGEFFIYKLKS